MPPMRSGFPAFDIEFKANGSIAKSAQSQALHDHLAQSATTDLIVMSHGWNNSLSDARDLYDRFFASLRAMLNQNPPPNLAGRQFAMLGVLWPAIQFADADQIAGAGAAAGLGDTIALADVEPFLNRFKQRLTSTKQKQTIEAIKGLIDRLDGDVAAQTEFVRLLQTLVNPRASDPIDGAVDAFVGAPAADLVNRLSGPIIVTPAPGVDIGGAAGLNFGQLFNLPAFLPGVRSLVFRGLNLVTYYTMKERAGIVGRQGVSRLLREIKATHGALRLHLVGHSFGGRLVSATAAGLADAPTVRINTLMLLQAAFSHHGFAKQWNGVDDGFFRNVATSGVLAGPALITCTHRDTDVGSLYPIASALAGQNASAIGDADDPFGGIGANGAQKTPEADDQAELLDTDGVYQFQAGAFYNLHADRFISGHGDILNHQVSHALLAGIGATV